jgi:hypothetical protein
MVRGLGTAELCASKSSTMYSVGCGACGTGYGYGVARIRASYKEMSTVGGIEGISGGVYSALGMCGCL